MMIARRHLLSAGASFAAGLALLSACDNPPTQSQFDQAKAYFDAGALSILAAAQAYLVGPPAPSAGYADLVQAGIKRLEAVKTVLDAATDPANWKTGVLEALGIMQQLQPMVAVFEDGAAAYVPLVIAVVTAFVQGLPSPAPSPTPPAALMRQAAKYRR